MNITQEEATGIAANGKVDLPGGYTLTLVEEPDEYTTLEDFDDTYGKVAPVGRTNTWGRSVRPEGYDGMAMIIHSYHSAYWWQPPADLRDEWNTNNEIRYTWATTIRNILDYGFTRYVLTLTKTCECCGVATTVDTAHYGGVEPFTSQTDRAYIVHDMAHSLSMGEA